MARALGLGPRGREFESRIPEVKKQIASSENKKFSRYIALLDLVKYLEGGFEIGLVAYCCSRICQMIKINFFFEELLAIVKEIVI